MISMPDEKKILKPSFTDLMLRKPRNARTDRLTDWRFFVQIYLVSRHVASEQFSD